MYSYIFSYLYYSPTHFITTNKYCLVLPFCKSSHFFLDFLTHFFSISLFSCSPSYSLVLASPTPPLVPHFLYISSSPTTLTVVLSASHQLTLSVPVKCYSMTFGIMWKFCLDLSFYLTFFLARLRALLFLHLLPHHYSPFFYISGYLLPYSLYPIILFIITSSTYPVLPFLKIIPSF